MDATATTAAPARPTRACETIDLPSPVPEACWRGLRAWLEALDLTYEPRLAEESGLVGYAITLRNYLVGVGLGMRVTGPALTLTAVLCRGMDRESHALGAVDAANRQLALGQLLYLPGPPAELTFHATISFDLLDAETFALLFQAMVTELDNVGFPAVMAVRGYHPTDYAAPWGDPMLAPVDEDDDEPAARASSDRRTSTADRAPPKPPEDAAAAPTAQDEPANPSAPADTRGCLVRGRPKTRSRRK